MHWAALLLTAPTAVVAQPSAPDIGPYIEAAAHETGLPARLIWAVINVESHSNIRAVSPKGAMGLMQLMPATWLAMRTELGLGADAFDPHDNILAGSHYLKSMYDLYGQEGYLAAYNAGPGRYLSHRNTGRPLPMETQTYVVRVNRLLGESAPPSMSGSTPNGPASWTEASLFLAPSASEPEATSRSVASNSPFIAATDNRQIFVRPESIKSAISAP